MNSVKSLQKQMQMKYLRVTWMVLDDCLYIERLCHSILDFIHKALTLIQFIKIAVTSFLHSEIEANFPRVENLASLTFYSIFSQLLALIIVQHYDYR